MNPRSLSRASMRYAGITMQIVRFPYRNSPVNSGCILRNTREIDRAVHTPGKVKLTGRKVLEISRLMEQTENGIKEFFQIPWWPEYGHRLKTAAGGRRSRDRV